MTELDITTIINKQKEYFSTGATLPVGERIKALKALRDVVLKYETQIADALKTDLGKSKSESFMCEIGLVVSEINYMIRHVKKYARNKRVKTPITNYVGKSYIKPSPYGSVLIMSPWNYPFLLTLDPLADALAAGNTAVVKPSAYSPATSAVIKKIISEIFDSKYVAVVEGGREENKCLLNADFDYIFFTGSTSVGKEVMKNASEKLIPVTLELGGKSPCIVDKTANIKMAAKRIVFGKFINCGQTCVAPDYIYCDREIKEELISEIKKQIGKQYTDNPLANNSYGKMINKKHFDRVFGLIDDKKIVHGGKSDESKLKIEPTVMDNVTFDDKVMQEEIFGPILPVLTYDNIEFAVTKINSMPQPLALYIFSSDKKNVEYVTDRVLFGGGCVNDTIVHLATSDMGFGGVGASGMGSYHGKSGFDAFSHYKSIHDKKTFIDMPMRYQPYDKFGDAVISFFLKK